jgi:hypothetical protein
MRCNGTKAIIIQHCATFGNIKTPVRKFEVADPKPYAQYAQAIQISFVEPRRWAYITIRSDNYRYATIETEDGKVLYDSRVDVPCDMAKWNPLYQQNKARWLKRQEEIDRENAMNKDKGVHTEQMGDFRD